MSQYLSLKEVLARYNVSKSSWYRWMDDGFAPRPQKIGLRCIRWYLPDLIEWDKDRRQA